MECPCQVSCRLVLNSWLKTRDTYRQTHSPPFIIQTSHERPFMPLQASYSVASFSWASRFELAFMVASLPRASCLHSRSLFSLGLRVRILGRYALRLSGLVLHTCILIRFAPLGFTLCILFTLLTSALRSHFREKKCVSINSKCSETHLKTKNIF